MLAQGRGEVFGEPVVHDPPGAPVGDEPGGARRPQPLADRVFGGIEGSCEVPGAQFLDQVEGVADSDPDRVRQQPEQSRRPTGVVAAGVRPGAIGSEMWARSHPLSLAASAVHSCVI
jgi:hypothetical protein